MADSSASRKRPASSSASEPPHKKPKNTQRRNYELLSKAKNMWESIRDTTKIKDEQRQQLISELLQMTGENLLNLCTRHDGSRVLQSCLAHGTPEQRRHIVQHLRSHFVKLSQSSYGHFLVMKCVKYAAPSDRTHIIAEFYGNITKMLAHRDAADVINFVYLNFSNGRQRATLVEEFYGPQYKLFKTSETRTFDSIVSSEPHKKTKLLESMRESLSKMIDKGLVYHAITHHVLLEYFEHANLTDRIDLAAAFGDKVIDLIKTKEGAAVATHIVALLDLKARKRVIKSLKGMCGSVAREPHGHMLLVRLLDVTDDTVLLHKYVLAELLADLSAVAVEQHARLPLLFVLAQRSPTHFSADALALLAPATVIAPDGSEVAVCKKPADVRRAELLRFISAPLLDLCAVDADRLLRDPNGCSILLETLCHADGDKTAAIAAVAKLCVDSGDDSVVQNFTASRTLKRLIKIEPPITGTDGSLAEAIFQAISHEIDRWALVPGAAFVIAALLEASTTRDITAAKLRNCRSTITASTDAGPRVITKLLDEILGADQPAPAEAKKTKHRK